MDYSQSSDFEINKLVAAQIMPPSLYFENGIAVVVRCDDDQDLKKFDPCNYPEDAWPIITENRIGIIPAPDAGKWKAAHREVGEDDTPHHFTQSDKPLRAAMIVFLQMQDAKHA